MTPTTSSSVNAEFDVAYLSDIGRRRTLNQDYAGSFPDSRLFIVADGMGGHRGGEVASQMAVQLISSTFQNERSTHPGRTPAEYLTAATLAANAAILERAKKEQELEGMGTTATSLCFHNGEAWVGHVGDSRCYLIRAEGIWQLTRDHSLVQEKLRAGMITRAQLKTDRMKNVITRSVGFDMNFGIDVYVYTPKPNDVFLMCSDGLSGPVEDPELHQIVAQHCFNISRSPDEREASLTVCVEKLVQLANDRGGDDNITVLLVQYLGER